MRSSVCFLVLLFAAARSGSAQEPASPSATPPALASDAANSTAQSDPNAAAPATQNHALSSETSSRVVAGLPKFSPRKPSQTSEADDESSDLRDTDKPRNGIIRLPRYHVREDKLPKLKNRELLTPEGKLDLAFKRRPGLKIGNLFGLNRGLAMAMLAEDEAYERRMELQDLLSFTAWMDSEFPVDPKTGERTAAGTTTTKTTAK